MMKQYDPNDMSTWYVEDNPNEKIQSHGVRALTDTELMNVVLSNGQYSANPSIQNLFGKVKNFTEMRNLSMKELMDVEGIGEKRALKIIALLEIADRYTKTPAISRPKIKSSETVWRVMHFLRNCMVEEFWAIYLNRANRILGKDRISMGGLSGTVVDTRIILKQALEYGSSSIVVCHNHPSGNIQPSEADISITKKLKNAAEIMEIKMLDHVIISSNGYYSFADEGLI